ncbi:MAG: DNA primase [Bacteroidetes bacterium]|nr:DNA primase [Bacteroidota bacterium]
MIPPHTIQTILETARIEEVVSDFVHLRKRGINLIGLCPFHNEKTPSFTVSPAKNLFKCFGCGKGGNSLKFIMEHERLSYVEALRMLAARYNIEIEEKELTDEQKEAQNEKESLMALTAFAAQYFSEALLNTEKGKAIGLTYFKERGFSSETIRKFQLGYNPDQWDEFTRFALGKGYQLTYLEKAGFTIVKDQQHYDRFRSRVIFPVQSLSGRVIGFGGRIVGQDTSRAKYINSPESEIYHKSATLYGIYFARNAILSKNECYLVEGYTDVISLHQAGFENVVASSGTSLTTEQIKLIKRFTPNITILYDGDEAGIKASFRGIDMILEEGMHVKIVLFPRGEDPDSFVRKNRQADVAEFLHTQAKNFITYKTRLLLSEAKDDPIQRAQLVKEIVQSISLIPDQISRGIYIKECSNLMNIPEQTLINELNKLLRKSFEKKSLEMTGGGIADLPDLTVPSVPQPIFEISESEYQEKDIIRLLLNYSHEVIHIHHEENPDVVQSVKVGDFIIQDLVKDEISFSNPIYQAIFNEFLSRQNEGFLPDDQYFIQHPQEEIAQTAVDLLSSPYSLSKNWVEKKKINVPTEKSILAEAVTSSVLSFKLRKVEKMITEIQRQMKVAVNEEESILLMNRQLFLIHVKKMISETLGRIITR